MIRAALLSLLLVPSSAYAQTAPAQATEDAGIKAVADTLPATLGGFPGQPRTMNAVSPGAISVDYRSKESMGPSIGVIVQRAVPFDWTKRRDVIRKMYEGPFFQIVREGTFTVPGKPGAQTFFGEYNTQMGLRQIWRLRQDDIEIAVLVFIFREEDRASMLKVVANELFGGAVLVEGPPASATVN